jgi:hypothetical protein
VAERGGSNDKPDLTPDAAAPPPGEPPDTIPIYGILGESGIASSVRLYLDRGMATYYDIPIEGIAGRDKIPADRSPLGVDSTLLFVRKGVQLVVHHAETRTVEDEFLAGDFTAPGSFSPAPGGAAAGDALMPTTTITIRPTLGFTCTMFRPQCPGGDLTEVVSAPPRCPSVQTCRTLLQFGCPPLLSAPPNCPSVIPCRTQMRFGCPRSAPPRCPTVQLCETQVRFGCPPISAPPNCPTVQACVSQVIFCGFGGG